MALRMWNEYCASRGILKYNSVMYTLKLRVLHVFCVSNTPINETIIGHIKNYLLKHVYSFISIDTNKF